MRSRSGWSGVFAVIASLWPAAASACDFYLAYGPMGMQTATTAVGAAVHVIPYEELHTSFVPTVDIGFHLGERVVIHPAVGYCWWAREGGSINPGSETGKVLAGGGLALNLLTTDTWSLGVQSHLAWDGDEELSAMTIPIMGAATVNVGQSAVAYINAGVKVLRFAYSPGRQTHLTMNYDPAVSAGFSLPIGSLRLSGGMLVIRSGEGDVQVGGGDDDGYQTDFSFGGGVQLPLGG